MKASGLTRYDAARSALAEAVRIDDAKEIRDAAAAMLTYARQRDDVEMERWVAEIKLRAHVRIGELSAALEKVKPRPGKPLAPGATGSKLAVLGAAGISPRDASRCEALAADTEAVERYINEAALAGEPVTIKAALAAANKQKARAERVESLVEMSKGNTPLGEIAERYPVIYADPPWRYEHSKTENRVIENHYPTMDLDEIKALPLAEISTEACILFLWATSPKLTEALDVLHSWGFTYRTCAVWDKQKIGMGYYFRQQHELLLVGVKGSMPVPEPANRPGSVFSFPRGAHSAKPVEVYGMIEAMYPEFSKLELFCRTPRQGWAAWGNQATAPIGV